MCTLCSYNILYIHYRVLAYSTMINIDIVQSQHDLAFKASQANHLVHHQSTTLCIPGLPHMPFVHHHHHHHLPYILYPMPPFHNFFHQALHSPFLDHASAMYSAKIVQHLPLFLHHNSSLQIHSSLYLPHTTCQFQFSTLPSHPTTSLAFSSIFLKQYQYNLSHSQCINFPNTSNLDAF